MATFKKGQGKHGQKETSNENYSEFLRKKFNSLVDTPKWADLDQNRDKGDDSDDEFFRVTWAYQLSKFLTKARLLIF